MLRVFATPCSAGNPYCDLLHDAIEHERINGEQIEVSEYRSKKLIADGCDVWHIHWPEIFYQNLGKATAAANVVRILALLLWARMQGARIVWTIHNLEGHESNHPFIESIFLRAFAVLVHGTISMSEWVQRRAFRAYPVLAKKPAAVIPHGHYRTAYPQEIDPQKARTILELSSDDRVGLYFGNIRGYKKVPSFIRTFRRLDRTDARMLVAGNPHTEKLEREVQQEAAQDSRVTTALDFIPKDRVQVYFRAADFAVLPQEEFLNSGSALLALSFDTPVIAAKNGSMIDLQKRIGADWVRLFRETLTSNDLEEAIEWADYPRSRRAPLDGLDWPSIAHRTCGFYQRL
ncbi:glycosyltransferase [Salinibacter sp.]|uniref:glycosyltransferase n=1 Tax=Salinibacter sp. TaxID=2065818 RepID=UPI0021E8BAF9|nr:glycosyltransferase [Salinibacter sp.]